jgi:hypothetical protein
VSDEARILILGLAIPIFAFAGLWSGMRRGKIDAWDATTTAIENDRCALRGLVLLRGQAGEFVCVQPGAEKYRGKR